MNPLMRPLVYYSKKVGFSRIGCDLAYLIPAEHGPWNALSKDLSNLRLVTTALGFGSGVKLVPRNCQDSVVVSGEGGLM